MGTVAPTLPFERWDVAVCTLEKANNLLNRLIADGQLDMLGMPLLHDPKLSRASLFTEPILCLQAR